MNANIQHNLRQPNDPANKDVFSALSDALHRFFYFRTFDNEIADDLAQETITRTFQIRAELFKPGREVEIRSYLYATARHVFANYVRDQARHPTIELTEEDGGNTNLSNHQPDIDAALVWEHSKVLSPIEQHVLKFQYRNGFSINIIAKRLHKSINAIKLISSRAKAKLKKFEQTNN